MSHVPISAVEHLGHADGSARFTALLENSASAGGRADPVMSREQVLSEVASGALSPAEAAELLTSLG